MRSTRSSIPANKWQPGDVDVMVLNIDGLIRVDVSGKNKMFAVAHLTAEQARQLSGLLLEAAAEAATD